MPVRIMTWNIQNFTLNKFATTRDDPGTLQGQHIVTTIARVNPDILVLLEVSTSTAKWHADRGELITGPGKNGVLLLHDILRKKDPKSDWRLVPPLMGGATRTGYKEGVAVWFKNSKMDFAGPMCVSNVHQNPWKKTGKIITQACNTMPRQNGEKVEWAFDWQDCLPKTQPVGGLLGYQQNQLGAMSAFYHNPDDEKKFLGFPDTVNRAPYLTRFRVHDGTSQCKRTISLFSIHTSPGKSSVPGALKAIAKWINGYIPTLARNEALVIGGDFNANRRDSTQRLWYRPIFQLTFNGGNQSFRWATQADPTLLKKVKSATPFGMTPYRDYISTGWLIGQQRYNPKGSLEAIDAMVVAYGANPPQNPTGGAVNRVAGLPNWAGIDMWLPIPELLDDSEVRRIFGLTKEESAKRITEAFQTLVYFGRIRGASDHFAVYADV